ncbi:trihelix transcription factor ENAP1-like [Salvia miltiorrhiza]|uniref:trihelix transcription factor ENAP1-like n=1 Tax=Salvia miltiorrhiza TaxID=226208 RepID=UPI0025ABADD7|nr:trihelix transcription factor ENAP1-like [Salvia miltiorrhiza]
MATIISPSSPDDIPTATLALPTVAAAAPAPRRLPPPCWSPEETVALIDAYKDKWYSLRRGNLRGNHWQEVADDVASRCPAVPPKTSVQCRHKMEKLRKRYRAEIQRSSSGARRSASSWAHFHNMHSMEKGSDPTPPPSSSSDEDEDTKTNSVKRINDLYNRHTNGSGSTSTPGVRIKMPGAASTNPNPNPRIIPPNSSSGGKSVVEAIQALGEGFMRMEKMKMEMAQQIEEMRMEMELKRTEMILDSQHRIVDAFARAIKKPKNHHYA